MGFFFFLSCKKIMLEKRGVLVDVRHEEEEGGEDDPALKEKWTTIDVKEVIC